MNQHSKWMCTVPTRYAEKSTPESMPLIFISFVIWNRYHIVGNWLCRVRRSIQRNDQRWNHQRRTTNSSPQSTLNSQTNSPPCVFRTSTYDHSMMHELWWQLRNIDRMHSNTFVWENISYCSASLISHRSTSTHQIDHPPEPVDSELITSVKWKIPSSSFQNFPPPIELCQRSACVLRVPSEFERIFQQKPQLRKPSRWKGVRTSSASSGDLANLVRQQSNACQSVRRSEGLKLDELRVSKISSEKFWVQTVWNLAHRIDCDWLDNNNWTIIDGVSSVRNFRRHF